MLFVLTMKRQIKHMIKHRYLPFTRGKQARGAPGQRTAAARLRAACDALRRARQTYALAEAAPPAA